MALVVCAWNLPPKENIETYNERAKAWIASVLKQPGIKAWRGYRHPLHSTPEVVTHQEFDSLASANQYLESEAFATISSEMRALGCTEFVIEVWDASPVSPELRPGDI